MNLRCGVQILALKECLQFDDPDAAAAGNGVTIANADKNKR